MNVVEFIRRYFIEPIYGEGYNVYNTIVYGLLLGVGIIACYKLIERLRIKVDRFLLYALLPFLALASMLRALEDVRVLPKSAIFITPGIFITIFFIVVAALLISVAIERKKSVPYHKTMLYAGSLLCLYPALLFLKLFYALLAGGESYPYVSLILILAAFSISTGTTIAAIQFSKISMLNNAWVYSIFAAHFLDASATFVGVEFYNYWEEHIFEYALINFAGTAAVLFPLKILVLLFAVFVINRAALPEQERNFWYIALFILGFSPGLRDTLKIMVLG